MNSAEYSEDFQNSVQLHGHACIGLAVGYVAAITAMDRLGLERAQEEKIDAFLAAPPEQSFSITRVTPDAPGHARLFSSLLCEVCGEQVMEPRVRLREGKRVCIPCSENYSRGW